MKTSNIPVFYYEETESTNLLAREYAITHGGDAFFVAERQTKGRGRLQRSFVSPEGGIYLSYLFAPKELTFETVLPLTCAACVCVCDAIKEVCGIDTGIKWVNDIYLNGKKICGILTQGITDPASGRLGAVIIGVGINFSTPEGSFPEELKSIAGSIFENEPPVSKEELTEVVMAHLCEAEALCLSGDFLNSYRERSIVLGKKVNCISIKNSFSATVLDIDEKGGLAVILENGEKQVLNSGEITLRFGE